MCSSQNRRRVIQIAVNEQTAQRISINESHAQSKRVDLSLLRMVLVQVIILGALTLPQAIQRLHAVFVDSSFYSELETTIDMFIYNIVLLLTYLGSAMPFYIYTLTGGRLFQPAFLDSIRSIFICKCSS